jgi:hypothetical protein
MIGWRRAPVIAVLEPDRYFSVKHIFVKRKKDEQEDLPK